MRFAADFRSAVPDRSHPEGIHHNGGSGYYKLSTGYSGTIRFDLNGNILGD